MPAERTKVCSVCKQRKAVSEFYRRQVRGKTYCHSRCKPCDRSYARSYLAANPDRKREYDRRRRERRKADPEAYAIHLDQSRESKRRTQGISSTRYRTSRRLREADPGEDGYVSALPFAEWIRERAAEAGGWKALSHRIGLDESQIRVIERGDRVQVLLSTVDKAVTEWGDPAALAEMYPVSY